MASGDGGVAQFVQGMVFVGGIVAILVGMQVLIAAPIQERLERVATPIDALAEQVDSNTQAIGDLALEVRKLVESRAGSGAAALPSDPTR